jgi:hypothetical protein
MNVILSGRRRCPLFLRRSGRIGLKESAVATLHDGMYPQGGLGRSKNGLLIEASDVVAFPSAINAAHDEWKR